MDAASVREMVAEDKEEWQKLVALLDANPKVALHDPESPDWTARDVNTHLAAMMDGSRTLIEEYLAGESHRRIYDGRDEDDTNARIRQQHRGMSLDEARDWAQAAFDNRVAMIESVPLDRWDARFELYARADGADHYRGHMSYVVAE